MYIHTERRRAWYISVHSRRSLQTTLQNGMVSDAKSSVPPECNLSKQHVYIPSKLTACVCVCVCGFRPSIQSMNRRSRRQRVCCSTTETDCVKYSPSSPLLRPRSGHLQMSLECSCITCTYYSTATYVSDWMCFYLTIMSQLSEERSRAQQAAEEASKVCEHSTLNGASDTVNYSLVQINNIFLSLYSKQYLHLKYAHRCACSPGVSCRLPVLLQTSTSSTTNCLCVCMYRCVSVLRQDVHERAQSRRSASFDGGSSRRSLTPRRERGWPRTTPTRWSSTRRQWRPSALTGRLSRYIHRLWCTFQIQWNL